MNELRWILIVLGAVLLIGIYFWGRASDKKGKVAREPLPRTRAEPQFDSPPRFASSADESEIPSRFDEIPEPDEESFFPERQEEIAGPRATAVQPGLEPMTTLVREPRRTRVEPTFGDEVSTVAAARSVIHTDEESMTAELPVTDSDAPTLSMSETPAPRRIERRKIVALRLAAPTQRYSGQALREALEAEGLQHGKYEVFHRVSDEGSSVFSVASMVEPGTFDLERMSSSHYPGVTLFAQLPGPIPGPHAVQELVTCGKRLQEALGGTLQDDRGVPLTVHRTERLRQEVMEFERTQSREGRVPSPPAF
ncbi:MAG: cell division protein ZipA C-terminal FtsZ-binding domain-containing protein [Povalibacter sp.]